MLAAVGASVNYNTRMLGLYVILDPEHCAGRDPLWVAEQALSGGCAALQLRAKALPDSRRLALARELRQRCHRRGVPFWVNDRADIACLAGADGLHLGQDDLPLIEARKLATGMALGLSTHSLEQVLEAGVSSPDLIGFGPIFETTSKRRPDPVVGLQALSEVCARASCPVVAVGGITLARAPAVAAAGARYAAVISAVCSAPDPSAAARALHRALLAAGP